MPSKIIKCSIGVLAYNEAANIAKLLDALLTQKTAKVEISEIIVVSSASTDGTDEIVKRYAQKYPLISLISEKERRGKSAAINTFIKVAKSEILVIESADTIPASDVLEKLVSEFGNEKIGMTGGRPVPQNKNDSIAGYAVNLLWKLHHKMALIEPKLGEMVAFRKVFEKIPEKSAVDEASIEAQITAQGFLKKYIPSAVIKNRGPETIKEFIKQRRRIAAGHFWLKKSSNYAVSSLNSGILIKLTLEELFQNPAQIINLAITVKLEIISRILGWIDFVILKKNPYKWEMLPSTKKLS